VLAVSKRVFRRMLSHALLCRQVLIQARHGMMTGYCQHCTRVFEIFCSSHSRLCASPTLVETWKHMH